MVIQSVYRGDTPVDPWVNAPSANRNGDFSELFLLILAAAAAQNPPPTASESSSSIANESTNTDIFSNSSGRVAGTNDYGRATNVAENSFAESKDMPFHPGVPLLDRIPRQPEATISEIEKLPATIPLGEDGMGVSARVPRDLRPWSEDPRFEADGFSQAGKANGSAPGTPKHLLEEFSSGLTQRDLLVKPHDQYKLGDELLFGPVPIEDNLRSRRFDGSMVPYLPPEGFSIGLTEKDLLLKDRDQYKPGNEILLGPISVDDDVIPTDLKFQRRELHRLFGSDSSGANETSDYNIPQSAGERAGAREPNKKFIEFRDTGSRFLQQSRLYAESELHSLTMPGNVQSVAEFGPPDAHPQGQGVSFQHNGIDESHEALQIALETAVESPPTGAVIAHTWEKLLKAATRDVHSTEWRPVLDRVVEEISGRIRIGARQAVLQLDPPELGRLQIDLHMDGDKLEARILTETQESRRLLETHLPELRQALGEIRVELLDVRIDNGSWSGPRGGGQQEPRHEANNGGQTHDHSNHPNGSSEKPEAARRTSNMLEAGSVSMWA